MSVTQSNEKIQERMQAESLEGHSRQKLSSIARTKRLTADFADRVPKASTLDQLPLYQHGQAWVLFNIGGPGKKLSAPKNCIRILGFFPTPEAALAAAKTHKDHTSLDFFVHPTGKYRLVSTSTYESGEGELAAIQKIYDDHVAGLGREAKEFERYCDRTADATPAVVPPTTPSGDAAIVAPADVEIVAPAGDLLAASTGLMATDQAYGVMTVVTGSDDAHIVAMHSAHSTEADSIRYSKDTLSDHVVNVTSTVVSMCKWIVLDALQDPSIRRGYRHTVLNDVMQYKKNLPDKIEAYNAQCVEAGMPPKITNVTGLAADAGKPAVEWRAAAAIEDGGATKE